MKIVNYIHFYRQITAWDLQKQFSKCGKTSWHNLTLNTILLQYHLVVNALTVHFARWEQTMNKTNGINDITIAHFPRT